MMIYIFLFIIGLCFGSFFNVLIYRLPLGLSITGRSFCPKCKQKIFWYNNIPLLSFLFLRGRCRHCHSPISWRYPLVELITAILTLFIIHYSVFSNLDYLLTTYYLLIIYALIVIFFIDLEHEIIPDQIIYPAIIISVLYIVLNTKYLILNYMVSGILAAGLFLLLFLITRGRGMGFGDIKLTLLMGLFLGFPKIIIALYLAFLTGALFGVILILVGRKKLKSHIPFGPFLVGSTIIALFWGELIWSKILLVF
ncbi:MAG: prepilin peptidase [Candidatus Gottesmanbacteria bacterium]